MNPGCKRKISFIDQLYIELGLLLSVGLEYGIKPLSEESRAKLFWSDWLFLGWGQILIHVTRGYVEYLSPANVNIFKS